MKRERATELLEDLLTRLTDGRNEWPLSQVDRLLVFGSYARGALTPGDVDVAVDVSRKNDRWRSHFINSMTHGRDPYSVIRQALRGRARGISLLFERDHGHDDVPMTLLWERGEPRSVAIHRIHAIPIDAGAGRAPRHAMLPCFEGLEEWIPRFVREELVELVNNHILNVDQVELVDSHVTDDWALFQIERRWSVTSPLRRAAHAALAHLEARGADLHAVHLHGRDIKEQATPHFVGFQLRYFDTALYCFKEHGGIEWLEVAHPSRRGPLLALHVQPGSQFSLYDGKGRADRRLW